MLWQQQPLQQGLYRSRFYQLALILSSAGSISVDDGINNQYYLVIALSFPSIASCLNVQEMRSLY